MRRSVLASVSAVFAAVAATSCCLPLFPFGAAAGVAGGAAWFAALQPYLLILSVALLGFGFYKARRARQCNARPGVVPAILLWTSTAVVLAVILFPQAIASLLAGSVG